MEPQRSAPPELARRIDRLLEARQRATPRRASASMWSYAALAAALVIGLLPSAYLWSENRRMHDAMSEQSAAIYRLAATEHRTTGFRGGFTPMGAAVMYPPDGSWYVVVVRNAAKTLGVAWMHDGERTMLGEAVPHGNLAMLYLPKSHPMDRLALMDGDRIVAEATLSWQKTVPNRQGVRSS
jgi:hypothetical protein